MVADLILKLKELVEVLIEISNGVHDIVFQLKELNKNMEALVTEHVYLNERYER